jgi:hypothetical protein
MTEKGYNMISAGYGRKSLEYQQNLIDSAVELDIYIKYLPKRLFRGNKLVQLMTNKIEYKMYKAVYKKQVRNKRIHLHFLLQKKQEEIQTHIINFWTNIVGPYTGKAIADSINDYSKLSLKDIKKEVELSMMGPCTPESSDNEDSDEPW